jgi:hypothetical protein
MGDTILISIPFRLPSSFAWFEGVRQGALQSINELFAAQHTPRPLVAAKGLGKHLILLARQVLRPVADQLPHRCDLEQRIIPIQ